MASQQVRFTATVHFVWWVRPYLAALEFFCGLSGGTPDLERLTKVLERGARVTLKPTAP